MCAGLKINGCVQLFEQAPGNDAINDSPVKHFHNVERFLSHPACEIDEQTHLDFNLIEVSNGFCFSISNRTFLTNP